LGAVAAVGLVLFLFAMPETQVDTTADPASRESHHARFQRSNETDLWRRTW
jgi:hypothetical protein